MREKTRIGLRSLVGLTAAAATLMAFTPTALAADSVNLDQAATTQIVINAEGADNAAKAAALQGHTFTAVKLGSYDSATHSGSELASVGIGIQGISNDALTMEQGALDAVANPAPSAAERSNPMNYVSKHWLGVPPAVSGANEDTTSSSGNYTGKLRDFVTKLTEQSQYGTVLGNTSNVSVSVPTSSTDTSATIAGLTMGMYMIVDTTGQSGIEANQSASIPMLVGTPVVDASAVSYVDFSVGGANTLGETHLKSNTPTIEKHLIGSKKDGDVSVGDTLTFKLTGSVPLTTGFTNFRYILSDTPGDGLTYMPADTTVRVGANKNATGQDDASDQTLDEGTDYTVTPPASSGDPLVFNLSPGIVSVGHDHYNEWIHVTYKMQVNNNASTGNVKNGFKLSYSSDSANQPTDDQGTGGTANEIDKTGEGEAIEIHMYKFTMEAVQRTDHSVKLPQTKFTIEKNEPQQALVPIKFLQDGATGRYKKAADQADANATESIVTSDGVAGSLPAGQVSVEGLASGDYKVTETQVASGYSDAFSSTFSVHISADDTSLSPAATAANPSFTNDADSWNLVEPGAWRGTDMDSHIITVQEVTNATQLPLTGGAGAIMVVAVIAVLLMASGAIFIYTRRGEKALAEES